MAESRTTVLCLDCSPPLLGPVLEHLRSAGHGVEAVELPLEAAGLDRRVPDLLVVALDAGDARWQAALTQASRLREGGAFFPILCLVPAGQGERGVRALKAGADEFVELPVVREALLGRVEALLRVKRIQDRMARSRQELERMSNVDPVTGLMTRPQLLGRLREELERARRYHEPLSLVLADVVPAGGGETAPADKHRLRAVAGILTGEVREADRIGRAGATAFGLLMPQTHLAGAVQAAERLQAALAGLSLPDAPEVRWEGALGLAFFPARGVKTDQDLVRLAEEALRRAVSEPEQRICLYQAAHYAWQPQGRRGPGHDA